MSTNRLESAPLADQTPGALLAQQLIQEGFDLSMVGPNTVVARSDGIFQPGSHILIHPANMLTADLAQEIQRHAAEMIAWMNSCPEWPQPGHKPLIDN